MMTNGSIQIGGYITTVSIRTVHLNSSHLVAEALQEYILGVGQDNAGGLRDKPSKKADVYHTFYSLAGFSTAQHRVYQSKTLQESLRKQWKPSEAFTPSTGKEEDDKREALRKELWINARSWKEDEGAHRYVGSPNNRVVRNTGSSVVFC